MRASIPFWQVDAFAQRPFSGNPAAVMVLDGWPEDAALQAIAAENNVAETAFLVSESAGEADWELRWFAPTMEVRLCGHATLAAGHVLLSRDPGRQSVRFRTRHAGLLEVARAPEGYAISLPAIIAQPGEFPEAVAALGAMPEETWRNSDGYNLFIYRDEAEVRALAPDFTALAGLGTDSFTATAPGDRTDVVSRVFVPGSGMNEDQVTGSAHAVLAPFWAARLGTNAFTAFQASARAGYLTCRLDGDRVWLCGPCVTIIEGRFFL